MGALVCLTGPGAVVAPLDGGGWVPMVLGVTDVTVQNPLQDGPKVPRSH